MKNLPTIYGFNKSSDIGVNSFGVSIFLSGCNLRCPYCMNSRLVLKDGLAPVDLEEVKKFVVENKKEWVMISGGEPTCTRIENLENLLDEIRSWGCKISLSTNGTNSDTLRHIIKKVDYVAMDFKTSRADLVYQEKGLIDVLRSLYILMNEKKNRNGFDYEVRTTLYPPFVNKDDITQMAQVLDKNGKWVLQQFRVTSHMLNDLETKPYTEEEANEFLKIAKQYIPQTSVGYV